MRYCILRRVVLIVTLLAAGGLSLTGCEKQEQSGSREQPTGPAAAAPPEYAAGESLFNASCSGCHGPGATGTGQGPPLVHRIYEPGHHGDFSFHRAVRQGVTAHHWNFGNMPRIEGLTEKQVDQIISYVRWLQRQAGIH